MKPKLRAVLVFLISLSLFVLLFAKGKSFLESIVRGELLPTTVAIVVVILLLRPVFRALGAKIDRAYVSNLTYEERYARLSQHQKDQLQALRKEVQLAYGQCNMGDETTDWHREKYESLQRAVAGMERRFGLS